MSHNVICDGCQEEKHEDYVEWRVCERCISQCNGEAADKLERLRAERDRAIREKNGLFDALRDKKPTTVNVQVASTGQQETIDKQAQRIASLEEALEKQPDLIDVLEQTANALGRYADDGNRAIIGVAENAIKFHREAIAKEQDDDT